MAFSRAADLSAKLGAKLGVRLGANLSAKRFCATTFRAITCAILATAFAGLVGVSAAQAVEAVNVRTGAGAIDLTDAVELQHTDGDRIQVSTPPGADGIIRRIEVRAREAGRNWAVFALANNGDEQIDRLIVVPHYRMVGSGVIWPDLGLSRIVYITPSSAAHARARSRRTSRAPRAHSGAGGGGRTATRVLDTPAARLVARGEERPLLLDDVEALLASQGARHRCLPQSRARADTLVPLARRPVLFALARALGEAWPGDVPRDLLLARAFGAKHADESHRARLRVEIGRLRRLLRAVARVSATKQGFALSPRGAREVVVLARPVEEEHAAVLAFLADGKSWSSSALALALGTSQRTVQRALDSLAAAGKVQAFGRGRARRWMTPPLRDSRRRCYSPRRFRAARMGS